MADVKSNLLRFIRAHHRGRERAIPIRHIMRELWDLHATDPDIRLALRQLNLEGYPICTCSAGVYWATDPSDLDCYMANLSSRATKIFERMRAIDKTKTKEFLKGQMELFG